MPQASHLELTGVICHGAVPKQSNLWMRLQPFQLHRQQRQQPRSWSHPWHLLAALRDVLLVLAAGRKAFAGIIRSIGWCC
jgi:hypothetical protein